MMLVSVSYMLVLLYAAYRDYQSFQIKDSVNIGILLLSCFEIGGFPIRLAGAIVLTLPFLYLAMKTDGLGGGDIKFIFANGCMLGLRKNYFAVLIAFLLVGIVSRIRSLLKREKQEKRIALAPYLVLGYGIVIVL